MIKIPIYNKLMVVAHPDDESLFGGGQLVGETGWKVICVTNGNNPIRCQEFESVMNLVSAEYEIWNYPDILNQKLPEEQLIADLQRVVGEKPWKIIVTHNKNGEYGHLHHIQIHYLIKKIVNEFWVFDFSSDVLLNNEIWQAKMNLIHKYESQKNVCKRCIPKIRNEQIVRQNTI